MPGYLRATTLAEHIIVRLNRASSDVLATPEIKRKLFEAGIDAGGARVD